LQFQHAENLDNLAAMSNLKLPRNRKLRWGIGLFAE
jgi:hypothetical protein